VSAVPDGLDDVPQYCCVTHRWIPGRGRVLTSPFCFSFAEASDTKADPDEIDAARTQAMARCTNAARSAMPRDWRGDSL
jgi:hypothetical protein